MRHLLLFILFLPGALIAQDTLLISEIQSFQNEGKDASKMHWIRGDDGRPLFKENDTEGWRGFQMKFKYSVNDDTCKIYHYKNQDSLVETITIWQEGNYIIKTTDNNSMGIVPYTSKQHWDLKFHLMRSEEIWMDKIFKKKSQHYVDLFDRSHDGRELEMLRVNLIAKGTGMTSISNGFTVSDSGNETYQQPEIPDSGDVILNRVTRWKNDKMVASDESYSQHDYKKEIRYAYDGQGRVTLYSQGFSNDTNKIVSRYSYEEDGDYVIRTERNNTNLGSHVAKIEMRYGKEYIIESSSLDIDGSIMSTNFNSFNKLGLRTAYRYEYYSEIQPVNSHLKGTVQFEEKLFYRSYARSQLEGASPVVRFVCRMY
ncbi:MAG: hypothetical protein ACFHU9_04680 [Fluviicola sp.]